MSILAPLFIPLLIAGATVIFAPRLVDWWTDKLNLRRSNFRGEMIPTAYGLVPLIVTVVLSLLVIGFRYVPNDSFGASVRAYALTSVLFGFIGFLDDVYGSHEARGLRGHFNALRKGKITTGLIKAIFGPLSGFFVMWMLKRPLEEILISGMLIALTANVFNLLDLRPGRTIVPFCVLAILWLILTPITSHLIGIEPLCFVLLGALRIVVHDRRGQVMLGDTGSNLLGAVMGLTFALTLALWIQMGLIVFFLGLHLLSERKSFSQIIEQTPALKAIDRLLGVR